MYQLKNQGGRTYPEFDQVNKFIQQANNSDNPDARALMAACKIAKSVNLRLKGLINTRQTAVTSFDFVIKNKTTGEIDAETTNLLKRTIYRILKKHVTTPLFGCFAMKMEWVNDELNGNMKLPQKIKFFSPTETLQTENGINIVDDDNKVIHQLSLDDYNPEFLFEIDDDFEERGGLMRAILILEVLRWNMRSENANLLTHLKGILQIINQGDPEGQDQADAIEAAKSARKHKFVVTNELIEFKLNQIVSGDLSAFKSLIDDINSEISIAILGQANTQQLPNSGGSRAALQILKLISADIHYSDMIRCTQLINDLLLKYYRVNFDETASESPFVFEFFYDDEENHLNNADIISVALNAGIPLKKNEVYQKIGFTVPELNDLEIITTAVAS